VHAAAGENPATGESVLNELQVWRLVHEIQPSQAQGDGPEKADAPAVPLRQYMRSSQADLLGHGSDANLGGKKHQVTLFVTAFT